MIYLRALISLALTVALFAGVMFPDHLPPMLIQFIGLTLIIAIWVGLGLVGWIAIHALLFGEDFE